eukprot:s2088_g5.t1
MTYDLDQLIRAFLVLRLLLPPPLLVPLLLLLLVQWTGLPYFSVFRLNAEIMFGAVQGDDHPTQCYGRNFASQTIPFPPGQDPMKNPYTTITHEMRKGLLCEALQWHAALRWPRLPTPLPKAREVNGTLSC